MKSKEPTQNNLPEKIDQAKSFLEDVNNTANNIDRTLNTSRELVDNINDLQKTFLESQKISSYTTLGLEKIKQDHNTINKVIDKEYSKQDRQMDNAERIIDMGLASGDFDVIKLGLDRMTGVANHNPMAALKNNQGAKNEKDTDDDYDDFYIEI